MTTIFIKDLIERVVKTFAEVMLGFLAADKLFTEVDWSTALQTSGMACLIAVLVNLATFKFSGNGTASLIPEIVDDSPGQHATDR